MPQRILEPGEIELLASSEIPFLRVPGRSTLFAERAARLRQLAPGHAMSGYVELIAMIADTQHWALQNMPGVGLPRPEEIERSRTHAMPPLDIRVHRRDAAWCDLLRRMLRLLMDRTEGAPRQVIARLDGESDELYEAQA